MGASLIGRGGSLGTHDGRRRRKRELVRAAGELLPVSAVGADGTVVLEDGSLVHVVACAPPNQESMDSEAVEQAFWGFRALAASLERGQVLQLQVEGDLLETGEHMGFYCGQLEARYGLDAGAVDEREALSLPEDLRARWALCRMLEESVRRSAPEGHDAQALLPDRALPARVRPRPEPGRCTACLAAGPPRAALQAFRRCAPGAGAGPARTPAGGAPGA